MTRRAGVALGITICSLVFVLVLAGCGGGGSANNGPTAPAAPTALKATAGNAQVALTWTASANATSYNVKRATTSGGPYSTLASPASASYTDASAANGTTYYYVVSAVNSGGESANSSEVSATPQGAPAAPTSLKATAGNAQVALTWTASANATSYNVKRATTSGGPYSTLASPASASYTDASAANGTNYYYVVSAVNTAGESANSSEVSATPIAAPSTPTSLKATAGNAQVALTWTASANATSYSLRRGLASGGPYSAIATPSSAAYTDTSVTNGTAYYYVVAAVNAGGTSANSNEASAIPTGTTSGIQVTIDVLANRHSISPFIYGGAYPQNVAAVSDSGMSVVRWGGNATSTYNWQLGTTNSAADYYFEDYAAAGFGDNSDASSTQFITDVRNAGSHPLMTMVMLPWVAKSAETSVTQGGTNNYHWSYPVSTYGAQCSTDYWNADAGNGLKPDCSTRVTTAAVTGAYDPLLNDHSESCSGGNCVYRSDWAAALATAFGSATCAIPYSTITSCHFYDMDNEMDIWGGTHVDIHPAPASYDELANIYVDQATRLKTWDAQAVRFGPVSCCWWFYWNGADNNDKAAHGGEDFVPWWLNQVYWRDQISGARSLDVVDLHAYPSADTGGLSSAQVKALAASAYRDYWDPTLVSPSGEINQQWTTSIQPNKTIAFRIPRMRAIVNATYPGTPLAFTEWSAAYVSESDFSTALGDADAYGIFGRERLSLASRWEAPSSANPNYLALKLYTNYDGAHHAFGTTSVADTHTADPALFSSYAALDAAATTLTVMVINRDPQNAAQVQFALAGFQPATFTSYRLAASAPSSITASSAQSWSASQTFPAYSATLLVISGAMASKPVSEWELNPDVVMVPASGSVTLHPRIVSGANNVDLAAPAFDSYQGTTACGGSLAATSATLRSGQPGAITVAAPATPGFCHFTVSATDGTVTQSQGGWIIVGNPAAGLATTSGDNQAGAAGTALKQALTVTLTPGQSGGSASGASIFFSATAGTLSNGTNSGAKVIAVTNSSGVASVTLTLPATAQTVKITAEAPYSLGHATATFTATAQ